MAFCRGKNQKLLFKVDSDIEVSQVLPFQGVLLVSIALGKELLGLQPVHKPLAKLELKIYHQMLFILSFYTQKCNSQAALLRNTLLCQRLFPLKLYFCSRKIKESSKTVAK